MDNRTIDVTSEGCEGLELALRLIWPSAPGGKATHFKRMRLKRRTQYFPKPNSEEIGSHYTQSIEAEDGTPTLVLLWHEENGASELPYPMTLEDVVPFVEGWLKAANYGTQPDHDGDNGKGWRVFTEGWGHVADHRYAIVGIQPVWAMYGK